MTSRQGNFIWYELLTTDLPAAARFYTQVAGWTQQASSTPGVDYRMWSMDGEYVGGSMVIPPEPASNGMKPAWLGYINVADLDASLASLTASGGAIHMPATSIEHVGRFALVADPQGASFYVMTPAGEGQSTAFAPGRPGHGGWHELHTTDVAAAMAFYRKQFGWGDAGAIDMGPAGTYQMFDAGDDAIGGMTTAGDARPSWLYYVNVADIEAAKSRVSLAGGTVVSGPREVPGGRWIVQAQDPQGAMFALVGPRSA